MTPLSRWAGRVLVAATCGVALPAPAQEAEPSLGSGLTFSGAPTLQSIQAQQKVCEAGKPTRRAGTIGETTYRRMERILVAVGKNEYTESEQKLIELSEGARGDYEKAVVLQTLAYVYAMQNKFGKAIGAYEQALATNALPLQVHEQMLFNVAQMYMSDDKLDKGQQVLNRYMQESCNPVPEAHISLAIIHADKKQFRESLKHADLALIKSKTPREAWLQLKLALHFELKEMARCAEVLVHLIAMAPMKETYFKQLQGVLTEIKKDHDALAVLALAERSGFLDEENELRNLYNMYMFMEIPLKAANVLDRGIAQKQVQANEKNLESLANAWLMAREYDKAEAAMARAAQASDKGELYKQLGQIRMEKEDWKGALESLQQARKKGNLKNPGEAAFLVGVCAVQLKQWKTAEAALREAMQHEKTAKMAAEWLNHLQAEYAYSTATSGEPPADSDAETGTN